MRNVMNPDAGSAVAMDTRGLARLRQEAKTAPDAALRAAAGQFEALFMQMLLKSMRDALPQDGPFASETTKTYTAMFDQQMAQVLARKGVGIADLLVKQLSGRAGAESERPVRATPASGSPGGAAVGAAAAPAAARTPPPLAAAPASRPTGPASSAVPVSAATAAPASGLPESARAFLEKMRPHAEAAAQAAGIPVTFLLAQAALETGWGRHQPRAADGALSHNLFGIKAGASWQGAKTLSATTEYVAGKARTALESFRAYASYAESFQDFARLMRGSARYAGVLTATRDGSVYAQRLQQAGYATDPRYAEKLARIIEAVGRHGASRPAQVLLDRADKGSGTA